MSRFADVTTDTPHGPRPVPAGHIATDDSPARSKSLRSTLLVWGGLGLALTVGALAARAAASAVSSAPADDQPPPRQGPRPRHAPAYAVLDDERRARMRARARADFADYEEHAAELRARARHKRRRPARSAGFGDNIGTTARNIVALIGAAGTALEGFRQVSAHSDEIMRDFGNAADRLQEFLGMREAKTPDAEETKAPADTGRSAEDKRTHSL